MPRFERKHVLTMVLSVVVAAVLTPFSVSAVSTAPVTLYNAGGTQAAKVNALGALKVDATGSGLGSRSGTGSIAGQGHAVSLVTLTSSGETFGVTQLNLSGFPNFADYHVTVDLWTRVSGSQTCAAVASQVTTSKATPTGFGITHVREYELFGNFVTNFTFPTSPLRVGPTSTAYACLGVRMISAQTTHNAVMHVYAGLTGYRVS